MSWRASSALPRGIALRQRLADGVICRDQRRRCGGRRTGRDAGAGCDVDELISSSLQLLDGVAARSASLQWAHTDGMRCSTVSLSVRGQTGAAFGHEQAATLGMAAARTDALSWFRTRCGLG